MTSKNRGLIIFILGMLCAIGPFSIDMYLPGFPAIAKDLNVSVETVGYSLSSFFIGISLGQLICGPLLDRFGRKLPLLSGLTVYIIATIGCVFSNDITTLIIFRFFQALGGCVGIVAPRAMIRDLFPVKENAKIFSLMILILGVSPIVAPTAGGWLVAHLGWHSVFVVLAIIGVAITVLVALCLPESKGADKDYSLKPAPILNKFITVARVPQFYTYALVGGLSSAALFAYLSGSPFVFMSFFGATEKQYGFIFAIIALGLIICSQVNNLMLRKYSSEQIIKVTLRLQVIIGLLLFLGSISGFLNMYATIALIATFLSCQGFTFPNATALAMAPFSKMAGSASAVMGATQMGLAALVSAGVSGLHATNAGLMAGGMLLCAATAAIILFVGSKQIVPLSNADDLTSLKYFELTAMNEPEAAEGQADRSK